MKKNLLSGVALAGIVSFQAYAADTNAVSPISVNIGGFLDFQTAIIDQKFDSGASNSGASLSGYTRGYHFVNDTEIHFNISAATDNGLEYGAVIQLNADVDADVDSDGSPANKEYLWLQSDIGRLELGNNNGVDDSLKVDASTIARATGGADGDFYRFINLTGDSGSDAGAIVATSSFITTPDLPANFTIAGREDATKISYYSPRLSGLQIGISFTPDEGDVGTASGLSGSSGTDQENVVAFGLNYERSYKNINFQISLTGESGSAENGTTNDVAAWALGGLVNYNKFSVAGSWADWGDSDLSTSTLANDDQRFWTLGAAYEDGPVGLSLNYLQSVATLNGTGKDEFSNFIIGADYQLAAGLVPYVEANFFKADDNNAATADNEGTVILIGAELGF